MEMTYTPPVADIDGRRSRALIAGIVGLAVCALGFVIDRDHFFRSWLIAFLLFLGIALGSLALMMIQHLSGGTWGVFRRIFEASGRTVPFMAVLFVPVILGMTSLYVWTHPDHVQADAILRHKAPYLNTGFFIARAVLYFFDQIRGVGEQELREVEVGPQHDEGEHQLPEVVEVMGLQQAVHRLTLHEERRDDDGEGERRQSLSTHHQKAKERRVPVRIDRHDPVDAGKGHGQGVEHDSETTDPLDRQIDTDVS